jgi:hypothetical protein
MVMRVPVLAENKRVFEEYIRYHRLNRGHFDYIVGQNVIRGRRGIILTIGKWWRNPSYRNEDFAEILKVHVNTGNISLIPVVWDIDDNINLL